MTEAKKSSFRFIDFLINKSTFSYKSAYQDVNVNIIPSGKLFTKDKTFELTLDVRITEKEIHDEELVRILSTAIFEFEDEVKDKESISSYFLVNAPAIAFPYIRSYIASLTVQSGKQALLLPTYNLSALGDTLKENLTFV
tara:strand:+ start:1962 stop:2381 length:420 start_codon:yes stop_codon:yes gene_type:complete